MTIELSEYVIDAIADAIVKKMQEPKFIAKSDGTIEQIKNCDDCIFRKEWEKIGKLLSVILKKQTEQEPCREADDYENEIEDLHKRLDIAEYDKERLREEVTNLEEKIKALEQEPCEDCISRQAVLKQINCWIGSGEYRYTNATDYLTKRMQALSSVTPQYTDAEIQKMQDLEQAEIKKAYELGKAEPKTGHWKVVSDGYGDNAYICECSECKDTVWVYKDADRKWNFCPNCGTKMEAEE